MVFFAVVFFTAVFFTVVFFTAVFFTAVFFTVVFFVERSAAGATASVLPADGTMPGSPASILRRSGTVPAITTVTSSPSRSALRALRGGGSDISRSGTYTTSSFTRTYAPCDEYDSTTPDTAVPTGCSPMNSRKGSNSFTVLAAPPPPDAAAGAGAGSGAERVARPGGGEVGTGMGSDAMGDAFGARSDPTLRRASRVARFDFGPRTGVRATNTQPTCGTGLPPTRRPSSKSHSWSA